MTKGLSEKIHKAIKLASILHYSQKRKGDGSPYVIHPYAVAWIVMQYTTDEDVIVAALLHDVLEDVPRNIYDEYKMREDFGERVCMIVKEVTEDKDPEDDIATQKATWQKRKEKYLQNLENDSQEALLVACADKIHNLLSIIEAFENNGDKIWNHFNCSNEKKLWFYAQVLETMKNRLNHPLTLEFEKIYNKAEMIINKEKKIC